MIGFVLQKNLESRQRTVCLDRFFFIDYLQFKLEPFIRIKPLRRQLINLQLVSETGDSIVVIKLAVTDLEMGETKLKILTFRLVLFCRLLLFDRIFLKVPVTTPFRISFNHNFRLIQSDLINRNSS